MMQDNYYGNRYQMREYIPDFDTAYNEGSGTMYDGDYHDAAYGGHGEHAQGGSGTWAYYDREY